MYQADYCLKHFKLVFSVKKKKKYIDLHVQDSSTESKSVASFVTMLAQVVFLGKYSVIQSDHYYEELKFQK